MFNIAVLKNRALRPVLRARPCTRVAVCGPLSNSAIVISVTCGVGAVVTVTSPGHMIEIYFDNRNPIIHLPVPESTGIRTQRW
jgi:hypothetical protein